MAICTDNNKPEKINWPRICTGCGDLLIAMQPNPSVSKQVYYQYGFRLTREITLPGFLCESCVKHSQILRDDRYRTRYDESKKRLIRSFILPLPVLIIGVLIYFYTSSLSSGLGVLGFWIFDFLFVIWIILTYNRTSNAWHYWWNWRALYLDPLTPFLGWETLITANAKFAIDYVFVFSSEVYRQLFVRMNPGINTKLSRNPAEHSERVLEGTSSKGSTILATLIETIKAYDSILLNYSGIYEAFDRVVKAFMEQEKNVNQDFQKVCQYLNDLLLILDDCPRLVKQVWVRKILWIIKQWMRRECE